MHCRGRTTIAVSIHVPLALNSLKIRLLPSSDHNSAANVILVYLEPRQHCLVTANVVLFLLLKNLKIEANVVVSECRPTVCYRV